MGNIDSIVKNGSRLTVLSVEDEKETVFFIDVEKRPYQQDLIGKTMGDTFSVPNKTGVYQILEIRDPLPPPPPPPLKPISPIGKLKPPLAFGRPLTEAEVEKKYGVSLCGEKRGVYSNKMRDALLLISAIPQNGEYVYHDGWDENGDYIYSGKGLYGDQELRGINYQLAYGKQRCFLLFRKGKYYYDQGEVVREGYRIEDLPDANGDLRKEFRFRFRLVSKIGK